MYLINFKLFNFYFNNQFVKCIFGKLYMRIKLYFVAFFVFCVQLLFGQTVFFEDKSKYIQDVRAYLSTTKNANYIAVAGVFETTFWSSNLNDDINKQKIIEISNKMIVKGCKPYPHFISFLNCLNAASQNQEVQHDIMQHFFETLSLTVEYQEDAVLLDFLKYSTIFFTSKSVYKSPINNCVISNGTFDFSYEGMAAILQSTDNNQPIVADAPPVSIDTTTQVNIYQSNQIMPTLEGPVLKFKDINVKLGSRFDTATIQNTQGAYMFKTRQFIGKNGKFDWGVLDKNLTNVFVTFKDYYFNTIDNFLHIEDATFSNSDKLTNAIDGIFEFKSERHTRASAAKYPRFISYSNNVSLPKVGKNLSYIGGYALSGTNFSSMCVDNKPATLDYNDGKYSFKMLAQTFNFKDSSISADPAEMFLFIENDTIYHSGVSFYFEAEQKKLKIQRSKGKYKTAWFWDSYHKLEFSIDNITWDLNEDSMQLDINAAKTQIPAIFKSANYFTEKEFRQIQSLNQFHPLRILFYYKKKFQTDLLVADEIISKMKLDAIAFKGAMQDLDKKGFVAYSAVSGDIYLKNKAYNYVLSMENKIDFDAMYLPSLSPEEPNAVLEMKNKILTIKGVNKFQISDSSNVHAYPEGKIVKIGYNREIDFDGRLVAGFYDMKGKGFKFNYQDFFVSLDQIDSIKFLVKEKDPKTGKMVEKPLDNQLVYSSGTIYINDPENKSGKKKMPQYPKFDAKTGANVYFDKKEILGGAYNRRVFFKIPPFKTDSVKTSQKQSVKFDGQFISGGIFPEFDETLRIMKDNSLGFQHETPKEGYDLYGGKGKFFGKITLDHNGIRGNGRLEYLSAIFQSNDFVFYQDSVLTMGGQAKVKEATIADVYYPNVNIYDFELNWNTKADSMHIINTKDAFELYDKQITLEGSLNITPKGLYGAGMLEIKKTNVIASQFLFKKDNVQARHAVFNTKVQGSPKPVMSANNMRVNFNLKDSYADISPELAGLAGLEFPLNEYKTSIENARWDINKKIVTMRSDSVDLSKSYFYSTNSEQDSLAFLAGEALYDMNKKLLKISNIPFIKVADTKIIPDSNKVTIYESAKMKSLTNAKLIIDTLKGYHALDEGKIEIFSRKKFNGMAHYPYVNAGGNTMNLIFNNFYLEKKVVKKDTLKYTVSKGKIGEAQKFYITPKILFKGNVKLVATSKLLAFDGKVKLEIKSKGLKTDWFPFSMDGTTDEVVIALEKPVVNKQTQNSKKTTTDATIVDTAATADVQNIENENEEQLDDTDLSKLFTGLYYDESNHDIYNALISTKRNENDTEIIGIKGQLVYDKPTNSFKLGTEKRVKNETLFGNMMTYNDSSSTSHSLGKLNMMNSDKDFKITSAGDIKGNLAKNIFVGNLFYSIKMNMPPKALAIMAKHIKEAVDHPDHPFKDSTSQADIDMQSLQVSNIENEKLGTEYSRALNDLLDYKPLFKYAPSLIEGICISHAHMEWSHTHKAWHNKLHFKMSNILTTDINKRMKGYIEIKKTENGDIFTLFVHPRSDIWFYINYQPGRLAMLSSEADFIKASIEKSKGESNSPLIYTYVQADFTEKTDFLKSFYKNYLNRVYNEEEEEKDIEDKNEETEEPEEEEIKLDDKPKKSKKKLKDNTETDTSDNEVNEEEPTKKIPSKKETKNLKNEVKEVKTKIDSTQNVIKSTILQDSTQNIDKNIKVEDVSKKENKPKKEKKNKKEKLLEEPTLPAEENTKTEEEPELEENTNTEDENGGKKKKKKK